MRATVNNINKVLAAEFGPGQIEIDRFSIGRGMFEICFFGEDASCWYQSATGNFYLNDHSVDEWVEVANTLKEQAIAKTSHLEDSRHTEGGLLIIG